MTMMKKHRLPLLASGAALLVAMLGVLLAFTVSSTGAPAPLAEAEVDTVVVTTPIASAKETVDPEVAAEMNGRPSKVNMAGGIRMHAPQKGLTGLAGNGQGNGCVKDYGKPGQCLPLQSPMQQQMPDMDHPWTCAEVQELFPEGIAVRGKDTLGLDTNKDRVACGTGDE